MVDLQCSCVTWAFFLQNQELSYTSLIDPYLQTSFQPKTCLLFENQQTKLLSRRVKSSLCQKPKTQ